MSHKHGIQKLNYKTIRIFPSADSILFFTKGKKELRRQKFNIYQKESFLQYSKRPF